MGEVGSVLLIGFMGCGKSTIGKLLSSRLNMELIDTDEWIVNSEGKSINRIFDENGEGYFRDLETKALERILASGKQAVISVGGGMPVREENRKLMRSIGTVVYLTASQDTLYNRLVNDRKRPMLRGTDIRGRIRSLMDQREAIYLEAADLCVPTDQDSPLKTAEAVRKALSV